MLVAANIIAFFGQLALTLSGLLTSKLKTLAAQTIATLLLAIANALLGGVAGCLVNLVNTVRNFVWYKEKGGRVAQVIFTIVIVALSVISADHGYLWLLPMASALVFIWGIDLEGHKFKLMVLVSTVFWVPYDFVLCNWAAVAFDIFGIIFNAVTAYRIIRDVKTAKVTEEMDNQNNSQDENNL